MTFVHHLVLNPFFLDIHLEQAVMENVSALDRSTAKPHHTPLYVREGDQGRSMLHDSVVVERLFVVLVE